MGNGAGGLALLAANAAFRMYKDSFHPHIPFYKASERETKRNPVLPTHLLSGNLFPHHQAK